MNNDSVKQYLIDSRNRSYGSPSNFIITFDEVIRNIEEVHLFYASIPVTYYNIKIGSNIIDFNEGGGSLQAILDFGNYNVTDIQNEVKNK